ncbi:MAG: hypothetical protein U9N46_07820 [Euryarchaeota archaeon]|nr:hypothetical protein [Euryarchaeota archaeon]
MKRQQPTPDPRLARHRIVEFVKTTGIRLFSARAVSVQPLTLERLVGAGLIESMGKDSESNILVYHLPEDATIVQESRFHEELAKIREWSRATRKYTFAPNNVRIYQYVLESMVSGGLLGKSGRQYTVFWRSLSKQWTRR